MKTNVDLTNMIFGKLVVLERDMPRKGHQYWICLCSCGIKKSIREKSLMHAQSRSCGCGKKEIVTRRVENLIGNIFGKLTVLNRDESKIGAQKGSYWICQCSCGNTTSTSRHSLINHGVVSCGCFQKEMARKNAKPNGESDKNSWINKYKRRARKNGIEFTLTDGEFFNICSQNCYYCDAPPEHKSHGYTTKLDLGKFYANGIDRIDPVIGYVIYNCVPCCKICNFMKTNKNLEIFVNKVFQIADNIRKKNVQKS